MPNLITNTATLQTYLGAAYSVSHDITNSIEPFIGLAKEEYIEKAVSPELITYLEAVPAWPSANAYDNKLHALVCRALAFYGYYVYINGYATGRDGNNGLEETNSKNATPIRQSMLEKRIEASLASAAFALEQVLQLLFSQPSRYPAWQASETYLTAANLFIQNGEQLKAACPPTFGHYRILFTLKPYMIETQRRVFLKLLGKPLHDSILQNTKTNTLTPPQKLLLPYIQRALAYHTYYDALPYLNVVQTVKGGLRILSEFDGINNRKSVVGDDFLNYHKKVHVMSESYERELKTYLQTNAAQFPDYTLDPNPQPAGLPASNKKQLQYHRMR